MLLTDANGISFATKLMTETAAIWWYTVLKAQEVPRTWNDFCKAIRSEFVSEHHERRARDSLRNFKQKKSVTEYLSDFRNIVLTISDMGLSEKRDKFVSELKPKLQFEVHKANKTDFKEASKIAMRVEANFSGISHHENINGNTECEPATPLEIDNAEFRRSNRSK